MNKPSNKAYNGARNGDHSFLKMSTIAIIKPPIAPPQISGIVFSPKFEASFQE